jgi:hypothetical protein
MQAATIPIESSSTKGLHMAHWLLLGRTWLSPTATDGGGSGSSGSSGGSTVAFSQLTDIEQATFRYWPPPMVGQRGEWHELSPVEQREFRQLVGDARVAVQVPAHSLRSAPCFNVYDEYGLVYAGDELCDEAFGVRWALLTPSERTALLASATAHAIASASGEWSHETAAARPEVTGLARVEELAARCQGGPTMAIGCQGPTMAIGCQGPTLGGSRGPTMGGSQGPTLGGAVPM